LDVVKRRQSSSESGKLELTGMNWHHPKKRPACMCIVRTAARKVKLENLFG